MDEWKKGLKPTAEEFTLGQQFQRTITVDLRHPGDNVGSSNSLRQTRLSSQRNPMSSGSFWLGMLVFTASMLFVAPLQSRPALGKVEPNTYVRALRIP